MAPQREVMGALSHAELVERVLQLDARLEQRRHPLAGGDPHFHDPGTTLASLFGTWRARGLDPSSPATPSGSLRPPRQSE